MRHWLELAVRYLTTEILELVGGFSCDVTCRGDGDTVAVKVRGGQFVAYAYPRVGSFCFRGLHAGVHAHLIT
jgi:hypothetical protein